MVTKGLLVKPVFIILATPAVRIRRARARGFLRLDSDSEIDASYPRDDVLHGREIVFGARSVVIEVDFGRVQRIGRSQLHPALVVDR